MKERLKGLISERGRLYVRRASRLRWIAKARVLRRNGAGAWAGKPLRRARYVLWDPEIDTFTYSLANRGEMADRLARLLDQPAEEARGYIEEALADPELGPLLARDTGWRALFMKRRPPLPSHHLSAWAIIRSRKPRLVVETGILEGLGSRTMLRALQLNSEEGNGGRLISFDILPGAGSALVPDRLRDAWTPIYEPTPEALAPHLEGAEVGLFLHDSVQDHDHLQAEADAILPFMAPGGILMTVAGWAGVFEQMSGQIPNSRFERFHEHPVDHFYSGRTLGWLRLP